MIRLRDKETGAELGSITEEDLQFLIDNLEEEWEEDQDYYLNRQTLEMLKGSGTHVVLGLRDVMDDPAVLDDEWVRKGVYPALDDLYDEIWVYGLPQVYDPLTGLDIAPDIRAKVRFTGYLRRHLPAIQAESEPLPFGSDPFILVTPGGGGDGVELVDWVLRAYEAHGPGTPQPAASKSSAT